METVCIGSSSLTQAPCTVGIMLHSCRPALPARCHPVITLAITVERFHAVCNPTEYKSRLVFYGKKNLVLLYSLPAVATASVLNIPQV